MRTATPNCWDPAASMSENVLQTPDIDFTVYAQQHIPYIDEHGRRGGRSHIFVKTPTPLAITGNVRRRIEAIADLRWLTIYDSIDTCGRINVYNMPRLEADQYFVIKYGNKSMEWVLTSSRLLILHRETAEVYYEGRAGDEG
jgi:hypothetical protein